MISESRIAAALPPGGFARAYVTYAMRRTDAPGAYHIPVALQLISAAAPAELGIPWAPSDLRANSWGLLVGPSGDGKTAAIDIGMTVLREADPRTLCAEVPGSVEALGQMLKEHPKRLVVYREFGSFLSQTVRGYARPLREKYTELYDGNTVSIVYRKGPVDIEDPRFSLLAGSTPAYLERYTEPADWEGGFLARFCVIAAEKERAFPRPPLDWHENHRKIVGYLRDLSTVKANDVGRCVGFEDDAGEMWDDWYASLRQFPVPERLHGAVQRAQLTALKAALLYSYDTGAARPGRGKVWRLNTSCLEPAINLAICHLESIKYVSNHVGETPDMRDRQAVLRAVTKGARTLGEILTLARLLPRRAKEVLEGLVEERIVRQLQDADGSVTWRLRLQDASAKKSGSATPDPTPDDMELPDDGLSADVLDLASFKQS